MSQTELLQQKRPFFLRGVIPDPHSPTSEELHIQCDLSGIFSEAGTDYMRFNQGFQDMVSQLDERHAQRKNSLKGRGLDVKYRILYEKIPTGTKGKFTTKKVRNRVADFMPYPSVYASKVSFIRTRFYRTLRERGAIVLSSSSIGRRVWNTYFMLEEQAAELMKDVAKFNAEIDELNREIRKFEESRMFSQILNYVMRDIPPENDRWSKLPVRSTIRHISVDLKPMPISKQLIESYMDDKVREEVRKNIHESVEKIAGDLQKKLADWISNLTSSLMGVYNLTSTHVVQAEKTLGSIKEMISSYQLEGVIGNQVAVCDALLEAIKTQEPDNIEQAAFAVANLEGVPKKAGQSTKELLVESAMKMGGGEVSASVKSLIESML